MILSLPPATIELESGRVTGAGLDGRLTPIERKLLACLLDRPGTTWTREALTARVWGYSPRVVSRAVDVALCRLRAKVEIDPAHPRWIVSTPGAGVRLDLPGSLPSGTVPRAAEGAAVEAALDARLVTLTGPGGVGKSHLARALASRLGGRVCALDGLRSPAEVTRAIGHALFADWEGVQLAELVAAVRGSALTLLVLDDADHAIEALVGIVPALLDRCPGLRILVTSREPLCLDGERVVSLAGLSPEEARALFRERAGAVADRWADPAQLDALLAAVDRLPLGLELLAGWVDTLPARALQERVRQRPGLLIDERRAPSARHRSLEAVVGASVASLPAADVDALAALATFAGDFDTEAAEAVLDRDALLVVRRLCRRSLAHPVVDRPGSFRLFEVVRAWLRVHRPAPEAGVRLARWLGRLGEEETLHGPPAARVGWSIDLRAGVEAALGAGDLPTALRCGRAWARTPGTDVVAALGLLDELARRAEPGARVDLDLDRVQLAWESGRFALAGSMLDGVEGQALTPAREVRAATLRASLCREAGDLAGAEARLRAAATTAESLAPELRGSVARDLGLVLARSGRSALAEPLLASAVELLALSPHPAAAAKAMRSLGQLYRETGRDGTPLFRKAMDLHRAAGQRRAEGIVLGDLGIAAIDAGDLPAACAAFDEAIAVLLAAGAPHVAAVFAANRAFVDRLAGRPAEAERRYREALVPIREARDPAWEGMVLGNLGEIALEAGRVDESLALLEEAVARAEAAGFRKLQGVFLGALGVARVRGGVASGEQALDEAEAILHAGGFSDELARLFARRAEVALLGGDREGAAKALVAAKALRPRAAWAIGAITAVSAALEGA